MKKRVFLSFIIIIAGLIASCASTSAPASNVPVIQPEDLIGTKWISSMSSLGFINDIEFIDRVNCVYTLISGPQESTYKIKGNSIIISNNQYFLEGNTFFYKGYPYWVKKE